MGFWAPIRRARLWRSPGATVIILARGPRKVREPFDSRGNDRRAGPESTAQSALEAIVRWAREARDQATRGAKRSAGGHFGNDIALRKLRNGNVKASDVIFGKIIVKNQFASDSAVRECLRVLDDPGYARGGRPRSLADVMVERGLIPREVAEKAVHATAKLQAERYLKFAAELGFVQPAGAREALDELKSRGYATSIGQILIERGALTPEQNALVIACDPKTLDEEKAAEAHAPPARPAAAIAEPPQNTKAQELSPSEPPPAAAAVPVAAPAAPLPAQAAPRPLPLRGSAREFAAIAIRDGVISQEEIERGLVAAPPEAREDARALARALVAARLLARVHADQIEVCSVIERESPEIEVEGYYLVEPLGFTAEGPVILARRQTPDGAAVEVALEVLTPTLARDPAKFEDFRKRTGALSAPEEPCLARTFDTGRSGESYYLARALPPGEPLSQRIRTKGPLSEKEAVRVARDIALAIAAYSSVGLVHGSIRPENVVIAPDGRAILRDIGSTPAPERPDPDVPPPCADIPRYLAPEQIVGDPLDVRTDIYALGIVLFEAVTGKPPYDGPTSAPVIAAHLSGAGLPDLKAAGAKVSQRFEGLLKVMTAAPPEDRYRGVQELLDDLAGMGEGTLAIDAGGGEHDKTVLYGGGEEGKTVISPDIDDADLEEMRKAAAERRAREAAAKAGLPASLGTDSQPVTPSDGDPLVGRIISGRYRLLKKLGAGGMGAVYQAEHLLLHKHVALKFLHPKLLENEEAVKRFDREVKAASRFSHPGITQIFDAGEDQGPSGKLHYMVMEYVEGTDLEKIIQNEGALPLPRVLTIAKQVLQAVDEAHKKGIVHRDMKSDNIMICRDPASGNEVAKIMDFGIAKIVEGAEATATALRQHQSFKTRKGVVTGTPQYMSPEQAAGDPNIDGRSDLYSLGVILYEMCLGELPFKSNTAMGYLGKHIVEPPIPPKVARPDIDLPKDLERIILKALEKRREARYQTAGEMLADIEASVFPAVFAGAAGGGGGKGRRRVRALLAALLLLGALGAAAFVGLGIFEKKRASEVAARLDELRHALASGETESARSLLESLEGADEAEVRPLRDALARLEEAKKKAEAQRTWLKKGEDATEAGDFEKAREYLDEAARILEDDAVRAGRARLEERERHAKAAALAEQADALLRQNEPGKALEKLDEAARIAPSEALRLKVAEAHVKKTMKEAEARLAEGKTAEAAECFRRAILAAEEIEQPEEIDRARRRLVETLRAHYERLAPEERTAYGKELRERAKGLEAELRFRAALQYWKDLALFIDPSESAALRAEIEAAKARADEQAAFEAAIALARRTEANPPVAGAEKVRVAEALRRYLSDYDGQDGRPAAHFAEKARAELAKWEK
jgi:serine/threonine protein kinase